MSKERNGVEGLESHHQTSLESAVMNWGRQSKRCMIVPMGLILRDMQMRGIWISCMSSFIGDGGSVSFGIVNQVNSLHLEIVLLHSLEFNG